MKRYGLLQFCNCFNIMHYLTADGKIWYDCLNYAASSGSTATIIFLIDVLKFTPTYSCVLMAVEHGRLQILQYLCKIQNKFEGVMWNIQTTRTALMHGQLECFKYMLEFDQSLWSPVTVCNVLIHPNYKLQDDIVLCMRFLQDRNFCWKYTPLCPILFDGCSVVECRSCVKTIVSFHFYRKILLHRLSDKSESIVQLLVSFVCKYQQCDNCGKFESNESPLFLRCIVCDTTYYCTRECQRRSWNMLSESLESGPFFFKITLSFLIFVIFVKDVHSQCATTVNCSFLTTLTLYHLYWTNTI